MVNVLTYITHIGFVVKPKQGKVKKKKSKYYIYGVDTLIVNIIKPHGCSYIVTS